jgi:hypothetical protein
MGLLGRYRHSVYSRSQISERLTALRAIFARVGDVK